MAISVTLSFTSSTSLLQIFNIYDLFYYVFKLAHTYISVSTEFLELTYRFHPKDVVVTNGVSHLAVKSVYLDTLVCDKPNIRFPILYILKINICVGLNLILFCLSAILCM